MENASATTSITPATKNATGLVINRAAVRRLTSSSYRLRTVPSLKTNVTELPESRVKIEAEVPAEEVERRVQQAARTLGGEMRVPGFRKGKVPPPVVIRRLGREAVVDEAVRSALGSWYAGPGAAQGTALNAGDPYTLVVHGAHLTGVVAFN